MSPNSFLPSIVIVHSTAIGASFMKAIGMAQPALIIRVHPSKVTGLPLPCYTTPWDIVINELKSGDRASFVKYISVEIYDAVKVCC